MAAALGGVSLEDLSAALHERTLAVMKLRVSVVDEVGLLTWLDLTYKAVLGPTRIAVRADGVQLGQARDDACERCPTPATAPFRIC